MEIRQDAKSIFPKPVPAYADSNSRIAISWHWNNIPVFCLYSEEEVGRIVWIEKSIYLVKNWAATLLCTMGEILCDAEIFNWYIYIATRGYLYYKKHAYTNSWTDMASSTDASWQNYGRCADALSSNKNHPLYASDVVMCVGNDNEMMKVTREIPNLLQPWVTLQEWYIIRFINELGWYIRAVAVDEPYGSEVLLWDKYSTAVEEIIPLEWYSIIWATIYNWYHYLLSNKWLWLLNWYQYYLLKKTEWDTETDVRNCMCVYDDKLYFVANWWIYIYWAKNKNYADVLGLWHKAEDGYKLWAIGSYKNWIMVTRQWKVLDSIPAYVWVNTWLATNGEVQTMCYFGTSMSEIKQSMYIRIGYHIPTEWANSGDIHVYYRTEADATSDNPDDWTWHPVQENNIWLHANWDMRSPFATTLKLNCRFQWIQFKFVLTNCVYTVWANTYTKDTNLYSADLYYNVMLD